MRILLLCVGTAVMLMASAAAKPVGKRCSSRHGKVDSNGRPCVRPPVAKMHKLNHHRTVQKSGGIVINNNSNNDGNSSGSSASASSSAVSQNELWHKVYDKLLRQKPQQRAIQQEVVELYEWETRLLEELFITRDYSNRARPARKHEPVEVSLQMVVLKVNEILEIDQEIILSGFLKIKWTDFRLRWRKEDFGEIDTLIVAVNNIWLPDLALTNSNDVYSVTRDARFPITLTASGSMLYVPAGKIDARCELNLQYFPFDSQICVFRFESWVYNEKAVHVTGYNLTIDHGHFIQNPQWAIVDTATVSSVAQYDGTNFSRVDFYIQLERKSLFFVTYTVFPCSIISGLQLFSHLLPISESERVNFGTTSLVAFAVFHISVIQQVPKSSDATPLLAIYVDSLMLLIGVSLCESFIMSNWRTAATGCDSVPEPWLFYIFVECLGPYLLLGQSGLHWRSNYLRICMKLKAREDVRRKKVRALEKLAIEASQGGGPAGQAATTRRMMTSYCSQLYAGQSMWNVKALVKMMARYGDSLADLNYNVITRRSHFFAKSKQPLSSSLPGHPQRNGVFSPGSFSKHAEDCYDDLSTSIESDDSLGNGNCSSAFLAKIMWRKIEEIRNKKKMTLSERYSLITHNSLQQNGNLNAGTMPASVDDKATQSATTSLGSTSSADRLLRRQMERQLKQLHKIKFTVQDIRTNVAHESLRHDCMCIWNVCITAIDRIASFVILICGLSIPVVLFFLYPPHAPPPLIVSLGPIDNDH